MHHYYGVGYKSYGLLAQRNSLRIRLEKGKTNLQFTLVPDPLAGSPLHPVQNLMFYTEFGVGVYTGRLDPTLCQQCNVGSRHPA